MPPEKLVGTVLVALLLSGSGCAIGLRGSSKALRAGDPTRAAALARESLTRNGEDAPSWRDLGIAHYQLGRPADALESLDRALELDPEDRQALFFRARSLDALDRLPEALAAYGRSLPHGKGAEERVVRARIEQLQRLQIDREVQRAIALEDSLATAEVPENSIAVPDFANPADSDTLRPVAKGLAVMTMTDLARVGQLRVLERQRLQTLLAELRRADPEWTAAARSGAAALDPITTVRGQQQRLASLDDPSTGQPFYDGPIDGIAGPRFSAAVRLFQHVHTLSTDGIVGPQTLATLEEAWGNRSPAADAERSASSLAFDPATTPRLGRLLRARRIVQGSVLPIGADRLQLGVVLESTVPETTGTGGTSSPPIEGKFADLMKLQKRLVFAILDLLGVPVSDEERREIERMQTKDLQAFLAFCRGLDYEDRGLQEEAITAYREAFARDARFAIAARAAAALSLSPTDMQEIEISEVESLPGVEVDLGKRAARTGKMIGVVPGIEDEIEIDARTPDDQRPPAGEGAGTVVVEGDLPSGGKR